MLITDVQMKLFLKNVIYVPSYLSKDKNLGNDYQKLEIMGIGRSGISFPPQFFLWVCLIYLVFAKNTLLGRDTLQTPLHVTG